MIKRSRIRGESRADPRPARVQAAAAEEAYERSAAQHRLREEPPHERLVMAVLVAITAEYFLFAALAPGALAGRAHFALRIAGMKLQREFQ